MNIKEYIASGIVESCVLGLASAEERLEFEQLCTQYPELVEARTAFELELENQAMQNAITPPAGLKDKILAEIKPAAAPVVSMEKQIAPAPKLSWLKYAVAACLLLLAGSAYWNYSLYTTNKQLKTDNQGYLTKLGDIEKDMNVLMAENKSIKMVKLDGQQPAPGAFTTVYWDTVSKDAYLLINNLPKPATDQQYQLWALLNGQPIDLGFVADEFFIEQKRLLVKAKNVQNAQAFAITLEKKGRSDPSKPEGQIYTLGKL